MTPKPRILSLAMLATAVVAIAAGVFLTFGLGVALIVFGVLLAALELLVPNR